MSTLREEFKDADYRRAYAESFANTVIATQLRLMRGTMTQKEFADLVDMKQSRISAMEDENYAAWSTTTLKQIAAKRGVVFLGRFYSFGELLNWSADLSEEFLRVPSFDDDPAFKNHPAMEPHAVLHVDHVLPLAAAVGTTANLYTLSAEAHTRLKQQPLPLVGLVSSQRTAA